MADLRSFFDLPFEDETSGPRAAASPQPRRVHTVTELTARIRGLLEETFFEVWVEGELSNCRVWKTGHLYFTLKDANAQVRGVMFRSALRLLRFTPKDGLRVVARGRVSVYDQKGEYQLLCEHLEPEGLGARQLAFDQLKARLASEGLFATVRKRPLPVLPRKIGVVTSLDGAAVHDMVKVLRRRYPNAHVVIRPTRVQGDGADLEIARAIGAIAKVRHVDVVIVARGGGSIEDLWAFNEEVVARALAGCPVPTISGVGHESDVTIADLVADVRAPTPSAAAEMVVARKDEVCQRIDRLGEHMHASVRHGLRRLESRLHQMDAKSALAGFRGRLAMRGRYVADLTHDVHRLTQVSLLARTRRIQRWRTLLDAYDLRRRLESVRTRLVASDGRLTAAHARVRHRAHARLGTAMARLDTLSPLAVLARGYAVCWNADRTHVISDASGVAAGERVRVTLNQGELTCEVRESTRG